jgi:hypothetical protein
VAYIELVRSGGFAGLSLRSSVDTAADPAVDAEAGWYAEQLAALDLPALAAAPPGEPQPDRYRYALSVRDDDGVSHDLEFGETAVPPQLHRLLDALVDRARAAGHPG